MPEFLHEVVAKRERNSRNSTPSVITQAYNDLMRQMEESYQQMRTDIRAQESIDRYMSTINGNPNVGMTLNMPVIPTSLEEYGIMRHVSYMFTGDSEQGYRGWVRVN